MSVDRAPQGRRAKSHALLNNLRRGHAATTAGVLSLGLRGFLLLGKFAFIVLLARYTDAATVGIYALLVTIVTMAIYVIGLELHTFTAREIVSDKMDRRGSVHIQSHLVTLSFVYLMALPVIWWFTYWLDISGKFSFLILLIVILCESLGQELGRYLMVMSRPVASNFLQFIRGALWMPVPLVVLVMGNQTHAIDTILYGWLGGAFVACAFGFWQIRNYLTELSRYRVAWLVEAFMSARHYFVVAILAQVQYYSDRFIVQRVLGESSVGVYSFYQSFSNTMVSFVQTGVISVLLPQLLLAAKNGNVSAERATLRQIMKWAMILSIGISLCLAVGMPFLLDRLNKSAYSGSLSVFNILLVGNVILVASLVIHLNLYARRRDSALMIVSLVVVPAGLIANIVVVPMFGIEGAAYTFLAMAFLDLIFKGRLLWFEKPKAGGEASMAHDD